VKVLCGMCVLSLIYSYVIRVWATVLYVVLLFYTPVPFIHIPKLFALCLFTVCYVQNTFFMLLFVLWLFYSLCVLFSILCVLCFCIVLCIVSPYVYSYFFSICVQCMDRCHPAAVNKFHISYRCNFCTVNTTGYKDDVNL
jgi:hypothetical protein